MLSSSPNCSSGPTLVPDGVSANGVTGHLRGRQRPATFLARFTHPPERAALVSPHWDTDEGEGGHQGSSLVLVNDAAQDVTASDGAAVESSDRVGDRLGKLQATVWSRGPWRLPGPDLHRLAGESFRSDRSW